MRRVTQRDPTPLCHPVPVWGEHEVSLCAQASLPSSAPGDSSFQPFLWHLKCSSGSLAFEEKSGILYVHIYLPAMGLHRTAGFPALGSSHPLIPGRANERVGRDGLQGVMVLRWKDHTRPLENGTFLHLLEVKGL